MFGGNGRGGGSGGRIAMYYNATHYEGDYSAQGGQGSGGEDGAAGTVYLKLTDDLQNVSSKRLLVYNREPGTVSVIYLFRYIVFKIGQQLYIYNYYILNKS